MKNLHLAQFSLRLRLALMRFGWANGVACLLIALGCAAWLEVVPHFKGAAAALQNTLTQTQKTLADTPLAAVAPPMPQTDQRLHAFYDVLGETRFAEQQVKTLFALAAKSGLMLNQAEYKFAYDKSGRFHTYAILLPVHGQYAAIRPFCEQVLLAIPFASLDEINFKREAISTPILETKLRFTLHLDDAGGESNTSVAKAEDDQ